MPLKDTIESTVKSEVAGVASLGKQAAASRAYIYPVSGVYYFAAHRDLWKPLTSRLGPLAMLSVGVIGSMFVFTYIPQSFVLTFVNGPLAWITTVALVLSESAVIINVVARQFLIDDALTDLFDGVLLSENCTDLVRNGRELEPSSTGNPIARLGRAVKKPFQRFTPQALVSYLVWLPLNFIPVVGTAAFILVQGRKQGPGYHARYFQLKGYTDSQKTVFVEQRKPAYLAFGTVAMLLQLIPLTSIFFTYANTVGAALWAVELERKGLSAPGKDEGGVDGQKKQL